MSLGERCPKGHRLDLLATTNRLRFYCEQCDSRFTDAEIRPLDRGTVVRLCKDITTQPEGFPEMVVARKGTLGEVVGLDATKSYPYTVHMPTLARDEPHGFTEDVYVRRDELEVVA
jgi:hypothetical protein